MNDNTIAADALCSVSGCPTKAKTRGWCTTHYMRWWQTGDVGADRPIKRRSDYPHKPECSVEGCSSLARSMPQGLCEKHRKEHLRSTAPPCLVESCDLPRYRSDGYCQGHDFRVRKFGDPQVDKPLRGHYPDGTRIIKSDGYVMVFSSKIPSGRIYEHRMIMEQILGRKLFKGESVHHINGQRTDNRPENLELWTVRQPKGQRVSDLLVWAHELIDRYEGISVDNTSN